MSFELHIAGRYLRAYRRRGDLGWLLWALVGLSATTCMVYLGDHLVEIYLREHLSQFLWDLRSILRALKFIATNLTGLLLQFVILMMVFRLTIFSALSAFGLFLGTGALITTLSVMSGFEQDLKGKILGTHAHMVVTTPDRQFGDYREALAAIDKLPGVVAATPYLSGEVMLTSQSNISGVILKGIDPKTIGSVTDLVKNTDQGSLENLLYPERLKTPQEMVQSHVVLRPPKDEVDGGGTQTSDGGAVADAAAPADAAPVRSGTAAAVVKPESGKTAETAEPGPSDEDKKPVLTASPPKKRRVLPGVVIGRELAKNLRVYVGDDVNVVSPLGEVGPTGPIPKSRPFRVVGIFFSGMYEYDSKYVYMLLPVAQKFLGLEDEVTGLELKLKNPEVTEPVIAQVQATLRQASTLGGFEVDDWKHLNLSLFSALKLEKIAMFIALCFIILVAASSIVSNGIMLVIEKGREIAILKSMGASNGAVLRVFIWLGLYIGIVGTVAGVIVGCANCWAFDRFGLPLDTDVYYITKLPVKVDPSEILAVVGAALALSLGATLYPAWLAARLRPVDGLR